MGLSRRFLFNDASLNGACESTHEFVQSIKFCIAVHNQLRQFGGGLEIGHSFLTRRLKFGESVGSALSLLSTDERRRVRVWVDKEGPFWDRPQQHDANEYFECLDEVVTESALAEAAHHVFAGEDTVVVSLAGSLFTQDPLTISWKQGPHGDIDICVQNAITQEHVTQLAAAALPSLENYKSLLSWVRKNCRHLAIRTDDLLEQMGSTFIPAVAERGRELFQILNSIAEAVILKDSEKLKALCQTWLTSARFSDSSATEKNTDEFSLRMRFKHPCTKKIHLLLLARQSKHCGIPVTF